MKKKILLSMKYLVPFIRQIIWCRSGNMVKNPLKDI